MAFLLQPLDPSLTGQVSRTTRNPVAVCIDEMQVRPDQEYSKPGDWDSKTYALPSRGSELQAARGMNSDTNWLPSRRPWPSHALHSTVHAPVKVPCRRCWSWWHTSSPRSRGEFGRPWTILRRQPSCMAPCRLPCVKTRSMDLLCPSGTLRIVLQRNRSKRVLAHAAALSARFGTHGSEDGPSMFCTQFTPGCCRC